MDKKNLDKLFGLWSVSLNIEYLGYNPNNKTKSYQNLFTKVIPKGKRNTKDLKKAFQKPHDHLRMRKGYLL